MPSRTRIVRWSAAPSVCSFYRNRRKLCVWGGVCVCVCVRGCTMVYDGCGRETYNGVTDDFSIEYSLPYLYPIPYILYPILTVEWFEWSYILYPISCTLYSLWNGSSDPHTIQTRLITASVTELNSTIWLYLRKKGGKKDRERKGRRKGRRKSKKGKKESKKGNKKESKKGKKERNTAHIECFPILHNVMSYSWYRQPHTPAISIVSTISTRGKP